MSHIRVDGDTHRRVMDAVSKALDEQTASVSEQHISYEDVLKRADEYNKAHGVKAAETTPIRRKAKLSVIQILSIAAAAILVSGVLYVAIKNGSRKSATTENLMQVDNAAETTAAEATSVNQGIKSAVGNDRDSLTATKKGVTAGAKQEDTEAGAETDPVESEEALDENKDKNYFAGHYKISKNIRNLVPFKIKTTETGVTGEESVKALVFTGENGEKMSKSRGNVINPDDIVEEFGEDTLRTYEMFIGAFDLAASWSDDGVKGCRRFLERVWKLQDIMTDEDVYSKDLEIKMHQTIKKVSSDFENLKFNTGIAALMTILNDFTKKKSITKAELSTFITLLNPVAPHITEEIWSKIGNGERLYQQPWPTFEEAKTVESVVEIAVQINGKTKGTISINKQDPKDEVLAKAKDEIKDKLTGNIIKEIYVPGKIVNIVMK